MRDGALLELEFIHNDLYRKFEGCAE
ncbi:hypothetical protein K7H21_07195 [Klebsiella sp. CTHL.F3a]|nr:hypothetical protein [Klebsiella grimontii]NMD80070.1 hypothetical protein [Klebsiella sp. DNRA6]QPF30428.1 hypothetical protein IYV58_20330 [Klebsiella sp. BDA134-6]QZY82729.1 hypothetical protein K7H21_07195 [Klebsiella sp. CTHL.F3a]